jgi:hypothetical protein
MTRRTVRAWLAAALLGATLLGAASARARAETKTPPAKLATPAKLAAPAPSPRPPTLVAAPRTSDADGDAPVAARSAEHTTWWPWALIAAAAAGVGAVVFLSSGKDPSCPAGRTCQ